MFASLQDLHAWKAIAREFLCLTHEKKTDTPVISAAAPQAFLPQLPLQPCLPSVPAPGPCRSRPVPQPQGIPQPGPTDSGHLKADKKNRNGRQGEGWI